MKKLPFKIDLVGKTAVVTGGGGVLCAGFAKTIAACGANVCVLVLNIDAAQKVADEIIAEGGKAIAIKTNVLEKESLIAAKKIVDETFIITGVSFLAISRANTCVGRSVPIKLRLNTN